MKHTFPMLLMGLLGIMAGCKESSFEQTTPLPTQASARVAVDESFDKSVSLTNYIHCRESDIPVSKAKDSKAACIKAYGCSPASYLMARRLHEKKWAVNADIYWDMAVSMGTTCSGTDWNKAGEKAQSDLGPKHRTWQDDAYSQRDRAKAAFKTYLNLGKPILVAVRITGAASPGLIDFNKVYNAKTKKYDSYGVGHSIVVIGLKLDKTGTGTATYLDPLEAKDKATKTVNYTTLLNSMAVCGGTDGVYYMQPIGVFK